MKNILILVLSLSLLASAGFLALHWSGIHRELGTLEVKKDSLIIGQVERGTFRETVAVAGKILPKNIIYLDAQEGGIVERISAEVGSQLRKGDQILELSNPNLVLEVKWREAELAQQENNLRHARLGLDQFKLQLNQKLAEIDNQIQQQRRLFERYQELEKDKLISRHQYELAKDQYDYLLKQKELLVESQKNELKLRLAQLEAMEEATKRMEENLEILRQRLENLIICAPRSGQLVSLNVELGQSISPGQRIGEIDQWEGFKIRASLDERYLALVKMKKTGVFDFMGKTYQVDICKIYPEVREGKVDVDFEFLGERPSGLKRGQTLSIRLELEDPSPVLLLPRGEGIEETGKKWAYIIDSSGNHAWKKPIRVGRENSRFYEVVEGLKEAERVILSSYRDFRNKEKISFR